MKKLNTTELKILTTKITDELRDAAKTEQDALDKTNKATYIKQAKAIVKERERINNEVTKLLKEAGKVVSNNNNYKVFSSYELTLDRVNETIRTKQTKITVPGHYYNYNDNPVFQALVIGQISCSDVDSLVASVTKQFRK